MYLVCLIFLSAFLQFRTGESARILAVIPTPSYSHQVAFRPIWNELGRRGHDVVVLTTDPQNDPALNIAEIDMSFAYELPTTKNFMRTISESNVLLLHRIMNEAMLDICRQELRHPEVRGLLRNESEHFDLIMVEYLFPVMFAFAERFRAPYIGVVSVDLPNIVHGVLGNPTHAVAYPDLFSGHVGELNFWQRLNSVAFTLVVSFLNFYQGPRNNPDVRQLVEEHFGKDVPPIDVIAKNVTMVFVNDNPAFNVRPMGPGFVLFGGGAHLMPLKPLPQDLKEYLDSAQNGFIYFSLGSNIKSDIFLPENRKLVLDVFRKLPYKVLWKFDVTDIPDVPSNVKISAWLPQQDILRHPNIKVFITQGGLQSIEEAIFSHVPVIGIPFFADQIGNMKKVVAKGGGVLLAKDSLTGESLREALLEVISNPKYKKNVIEIAELSRDQPMTGVEKAVWWTEYVIRHKGARHFRNPAVDLSLYQYYFLDVIGFSLAVISVLSFVCFKLIVFIKNYIGKKFSRKLKSK